MTTFIRNLLEGRWFVRPLDASNPTVTYAHNQQHPPDIEHEDVEEEARLSQPALTWCTRHRHDDESGPSQAPPRKHP